MLEEKVRFTVSLRKSAFRALFDLARKEYRDPRNQAAALIQENLEQRGLLPLLDTENSPEYIVRAVALHGELLAACKEALETLAEEGLAGSTDPESAGQMLRNAISKAHGIEI